ncbi:MAG: four helix bundle protein [Desulfuromonadales bacterium]|nr:four helix bundle protein [Desulfuromonadales bacterium]
MRPPARSFQDLVVWQKAHALTLNVYSLTRMFPRDEKFGLTSQLRRSMISVPANIAEGFKKRGIKDKARFLNIAQGSLEESRYYLILARDIGYGETASAMNMLEEVSRILEAYMSSILNSES